MASAVSRPSIDAPAFSCGSREPRSPAGYGRRRPRSCPYYAPWALRGATVAATSGNDSPSDRGSEQSRARKGAVKAEHALTEGCGQGCISTTSVSLDEGGQGLPAIKHSRTRGHSPPRRRAYRRRRPRPQGCGQGCISTTSVSLDEGGQGLVRAILDEHRVTTAPGHPADTPRREDEPPSSIAYWAFDDKTSAI